MLDKMVFILTLTLVFSAFGSDEVQESDVHSENMVLIHETPQDLKVPAAVWDLLSEQPAPRLVFVPLRVELIEKTPGVLSRKTLEFQMPRGGGEVDLSHYVKEKQGSFYVDFDFVKNVLPENLRVFFISQNRKRKLDGVIHGSGCKSFYDVKNHLLKSSKNGGLLVNTTRMRHLSVLGGTFLFAANVGKEVHLTQVTFKDSKNRKYFCDPKSAKSPSVKNGEKEMNDESAEGL